MSKINVLSKEIYNKISAGEVVEKPASVVKELIENSIDAGANSITVEILDGGITQIKVSDNGHGIDKDDFDKVFLAHATSKIKSIDDLYKIGTLGFRGEALSSISAVSKVLLSSKTDDDESGYQVKFEDGVLGEITPIGSTRGTFFIVSDLFYNIPARKKFLRKPKLEENDITNYMARLIMANPNIAFKYVADNKIVYQSFGTGLYDAIYSIYGKSIIDNIFEFSFKNENFEFSGYLGKPTYSKPNRTYQTLIVNGRYVINQTISTAIYKAYENFLMKGNFPFYVINLKLPLDKIDVNVHPNKLDIKFEDSNHIFGIVYSGITEILYDLNNTKTIVTEDNKEEVEIPVDKNLLNDYSSIPSNNSNINSILNDTENNEEIKEVNLTDSIEYEINKEINEMQSFHKNIEQLSNLNKEKILPYVTTNNFDFKVNSITSNTTFEQESLTSINSEIFENVDSFKTVGTIFNTYIVVEKEDKILIIDQHAGHERLLYDKFVKEQENKEIAIQQLLVPHILETNYIEKNYIDENINILSELGFEIEEFGDASFKISTVPLLFENINLDEFFNKVLKDLDNKLIITKSTTLKEYLAKTACKSAVKGNEVLTENEITKLLDELKKDRQVLLCPHGRPIIVELNKKEIEKWFKRIV